MKRSSTCLSLFACVLMLAHATTNCFYFVSNKADFGGCMHNDLIKELAATFKPDIFLETGTYSGLNAQAVAPYFKEVHTVELSEQLFHHAKSSLASVSNVTVYWDNSPEMITKVAPHLQGHILFWLDAHYSGADTAMSNDDTNDPEAITSIRKELKAIQEQNIKNCTILIDDIRGFGVIVDGVEFLGCWAYPAVQELCRMGKEINPHFEFALLGDMLLMYDSTRFKPNFSPVVQACTACRLYDGSNLTDEALLAHERTIMQAQGDEKDFIIDLYQRMTDWKDPMFYHDLWYALVSMGSGNWQEALVALDKVPHRVEFFNKRRETVHNPLSYNHWRIQYYRDEINKHIAS